MKSLFAAAIPALVASQAFAGFDFAQVHSTLYSTPQQESSNYDDGFGTISSELATGPYGNVISTMTTAETSILMTSNLTILGGSTGNASATAIYTITSPITVTVTWDWTDLSQAGLWSVKQYGGTLLQRLSYSAGQFSAIGGSYGDSPSGTATFELAAGIYEFSSSYTAISMPATSSVEFNWGVIPAPGAAAFAVAGLIGRRRRA
jgi:hypothetical protein